MRQSSKATRVENRQISDFLNLVKIRGGIGEMLGKLFLKFNPGPDL